MALEDGIERLIVALNRVADGFEGAEVTSKPAPAAAKVPAPAAPAKAPAKPAAKAPAKAPALDFETVKGLVMRVKEEIGFDEAKELITKYGKSPELAKVKEANFAALAAAAEEALETPAEAEEEADEDDNTL